MRQTTLPAINAMKPLATIPFLLALCVGAFAQQAPENPPMHAIGTFQVKIKPQQADNPDAQAGGIVRLALDKTFTGALQGQSHGEMLADSDGSRADGAYVAIEKFTGTLDGREGSFVLVHRSLMRDGKPEQWSILVSPGSGTGALAGIDGEFTINIAGGVHSYDFAYTLPEVSSK
ncbi:MAG: DUF3224 domain-containing protein [Pseudoxanthomonas sp.]